MSLRFLSWVCSYTGGGISGEEVSLHWSFSPPIWNSKAQNCRIKNFKCLAYVILPSQSRHWLNRTELQLPSIDSYCLSPALLFREQCRDNPWALLCTRPQDPSARSHLTHRKKFPKLGFQGPESLRLGTAQCPCFLPESFLNREIDSLLSTGKIFKTLELRLWFNF